MPTPPIIAPDERPDEWYDKAAKRRRKLAVKRLEKAMPLFAPLADAKVPEVSGAELRQRETAQWAKDEQHWRDFDAMMLERAKAYRADIEARVPADVMAQLDAWVAERRDGPGLRARYLQDPTYLADHWHTIMRRLDMGLSAIVSQEERLMASRMMIARGQVSG